MVTAITPSFCTVCGSSLGPGVSFCPTCGQQRAGAIVARQAPKKSPMVKAFAAIGMFVVAFVALAAILGSDTSSGKSNSTSPVAIANSEESVHQIGQPVNVGYWTYQVNSTRWAKYIGSSFTREAADAEFLIVNMSIRNEDKTESTLPRIVLVDDQGREFSQSDKGFMAENSFDILKSLNPGVASRGEIVFDVPPGQYRLKLSGGYESSARAIVDLHEHAAEESSPSVTSGGVRPTIAPVSVAPAPSDAGADSTPQQTAPDPTILKTTSESAPSGDQPSSATAQPN